VAQKARLQSSGIPEPAWLLGFRRFWVPCNNPKLRRNSPKNRHFRKKFKDFLMKFRVTPRIQLLLTPVKARRYAEFGAIAIGI
jgi:hypothetical protein